MATGLTAPKCPSCKIILLRPVQYHVNPSYGKAHSSSASASAMHCPACRNQYSLRKGAIIPAILLTSTALCGSNQVASSKEFGGGAHGSPARINHRFAGLVSPLAANHESAGLISGHGCNLGSLHQIQQQGNNIFLQNQSFNTKALTSPITSTSPGVGRVSPDLARTRQQRVIQHRRMRSLPVPTCITRTCSTDRLVVKDDIVKINSNERRKLTKARSFVGSLPQGKGPALSPLNNFSPHVRKSAMDLPPPVVRYGCGHRRRRSLSDIAVLNGVKTSNFLLCTLDSLIQAHSRALSTDNYQYLQEIFVNTFSSWESISTLFKELSFFSHDCESFGIDMKFVRGAYSILMEMPDNVQKAVVKSIIGGFLKESKNQGHLSSRDYIRAQLILMENPQFDSPSTSAVFGQLLKQVSQLPSDASKCAVHWMRAEYKPEWMRALISRVQQFISTRQFPASDATPKFMGGIPCALHVLSMFKKASLTRKPPLLSYVEFYNSSLDHIDLMGEFHAWNNHSVNHSALKFSFCQYPFILSLSAKKHILQHDSQHQMLMMAKRSLAEKVQQNEIPDAQNVFLDIKIRRSHLIEDSISELLQKESDLKKKVKVTFSGEAGVDMGGLTKEWFLLLLQKIFRPEYGLFTRHEDSAFSWFSLAHAGDNCYIEYHLVGLLMGLAVHNGVILDLDFPPCCFEKLLTSPDNAAECRTTLHLSTSPDQRVGMPRFSLDDLAAVMPTIARSLQFLVEYEGNVEDLYYTFQVSHMAYGSVVTTELVPDGENIPVTKENRNEFIDLYTDHLLNKSVSQHFAAFHRGFHSVCSSNALKLLRPEELEALICGFPEFDMEELRSIAAYEGYQSTDTTIEIFWEVVETLDIANCKKLMLFVTGSYRVPIGGIAFKISKLPFPASTGRNILPMAHTCFNQLLLPPFEDKLLLRDKLLIAINNAEGFGLL